MAEATITAPSAVRVRRRSAARWVHAVPAVPLALLALALFLRLGGLSREPLWLDEGYTLLFSSMTLPKLITVGGAHEHPPLYYLLVHMGLELHRSYLVPRAISAAAGALSAVAVRSLGSRLFNASAGLLAGLLVAISPMHVWYSQDARGYELAGLAVLLSYLCLVSALESPARWRWALYVTATGAALYTEYTTVLVLLPQALAIVRARRDRTGKTLMASWATIALLFSPWVGVVALDTAGIAQNYWIPAPTVSEVADTFLQFLGLITPCSDAPCVGVALTPAVLGTAGLWIAACFVAAVSVVTMYAVIRRNVSLSMLCAWLWFPFALVLALAGHRSLYLDRIFLDASFPVYLLAGAAVVAVARHLRIGVVLLVPLVVVSLINLHTVYSTTVNANWRSLARDLLAAYHPGQGVAWNPGVLASLVGAYAPPGWHPTASTPLWYRSYLDVPGWRQHYAALTDQQLRDIQLRSLAARTGTIWLVAQDYSGLNDTRHWFAVHGYQLVLSEEYAGDTRLELWSRGGPVSLGPAVIRAGFGGWTGTGTHVVGHVAVQGNGASYRVQFPMTPGHAYSVSLEYHGLPPAYPQVSLQVRDAAGRPIEPFVDRLGRDVDAYPRTQWYNLPANGVWLSAPFGLVTPPGARWGTLTLRNLWGTSEWRGVAVYRQP